MSPVVGAASPSGGGSAVALTVVVALFAVVAVLGFLAARWRTGTAPAGLRTLDEWGLGGRGFGGWVTWFLIGGDIYTAYTFVAVPAAMFATGAVSGFFAVPYTVVLYVVVFVLMPRLWSVAHRHGYVTPADFVGGRYGSRLLSTVIAVTGIVATMPYIALQLVGIKAVLSVLGVGGGGNWFLQDLPLIIAFVVLAAYTYTAGLRAPALIAVVKDVLIYAAVIVAVIYLPTHFGGWGSIFGAAEHKLSATNPATGMPFGAVIPGAPAFNAYWTLALGSALALFMYPHSITGVLASKSRDTIRRNAIALPLYSGLLGVLALLGFVAIRAGTKPVDLNGVPNPQLVIPQLFLDSFPGWFAGIALAAIAIGALVPAAIMSIAASNLFTRNIYRDLFRPKADARQQTRVARIVSLLVKVGALVFVIGFDQSSAINLQLLGGIWILQTLPAIGAGLFTRWFHRRALVVGWAVGILYGTAAAYAVINPVTGAHFGGSVAPAPLLGAPVYIGISAFVLNLGVAALGTVLLRAVGVRRGSDATVATDYRAEAGDPVIGVVDEGGPSSPVVDRALGEQ